uniref:Uncharacterized protein n=1 Tax=Aegilops tauschii TaxID=37682 RepID=M8CY75_AEGTA
MAIGVFSLARNAKAAIWLGVSNLPRQRVGPRQWRSKALGRSPPLRLRVHGDGRLPPPARKSPGPQPAADHPEDDARPLPAGYIFMWSGETRPECFRYRVLGLPWGKLDAVSRIRRSAALFLYDFHAKYLYGPYRAKTDLGIISGIRRHIAIAKNSVMSSRLYAILSHQVLVTIFAAATAVPVGGAAAAASGGAAAAAPKGNLHQTQPHNRASRF